VFNVGNIIRYDEAKGGDGEPLEGMILEIREQIKISYHNADRQIIIWVDPSEIELSDTFECTHDNECGWCDGTGECIYE